MSETHSGKFNLLMNYIMLAANYLFPLITFPYVTRVLGAEALGRVSFASSISNYYSALATFGIVSYAVRTCSRLRNQPKDFSAKACEMFSVNGFTTLIAVFSFLVSIYLIPSLRTHWQFMLVFCLNVAMEFLGIGWYYTATEQFSYITLRGIVLKLLSMLGLFLWVKKPSDALIYAIVTVGSAIIINLVNYLNARRKTVIRLVFSRKIFSHFNYTKWFFLQSITLTLLSNMDVSMLGVLSTEANVGYYEVALKIKILSSALVSSVGTVFLPRLSRDYANKNLGAFKHIVMQSIQYNCVVSFAAAGLCMVNANDIIALFGGEEYAYSAYILKVIMPAVVLIGISTVTGVQVLISINEEKGVFVSLLLGGVMNLFLNILLIPTMYGVGAAIATVCSEGVIAAVQVLWLRKKKMSISIVKPIWKPLLAAAIAAGVSAIVANTMQCPIILRLILSGSGFGLTYLIVLIICKEEIVFAFFRMIFRRTHDRAK